MNRETTINALHYIADSTVERADGGFHPTTIEIVKDALELIGELSIYREICEAASFIYFGDMRIMCLIEGKYEAVNTQRPMRNPRVFDTLAEAFEWVKGERR